MLSQTLQGPHSYKKKLRLKLPINKNMQNSSVQINWNYALICTSFFGTPSFHSVRFIFITDHPIFMSLIQEGRERRCLRSDSSHRLHVPRCRLSTVGDRSFPVAEADIWNDLPADVASSSKFSIFRCSLKTFLFSFSLSWCRYLTLTRWHF